MAQTKGHWQDLCDLEQTNKQEKRDISADLCIPVPDIEDSDHGNVANYVIEAFIIVSSGILSLNISTLEAFLPACSPAPELYP